MSPSALVPNGAQATRPGRGESTPAPDSSRTLAASTALALALLILTAVLPQTASATPGTWSPTASMSVGRANHTAILLPNGQVLVAGGNTSFSDNLYSAQLFIPTNYGGYWQPTGPMAKAHASHTATLLPNGKVLVAGGWDNTGQPSDSAELYDPATGWSPAASMGTKRVFHTATLLPNGQVLVAGGYSGAYLASAELFDPAAPGGSGAWIPAGNMTRTRELHTATLLPNGKVLVAGGFSYLPNPGGGGVYDDIADADLYDPATGNWTATGSMGSARETHTATLLPSSTGQVLVAGGWSDFNNSCLATAEFYLQSWFSWGPTGSLATARSRHTATLLPNGRVLVAGGYNYASPGTPWTYLKSAELYYQPPGSTTGTWSPTGSLATGRQNHTATLLPNGKVLVAGGVVAANGVTTASAELYEPEPPPRVKLPPLLAFFPFDGNTNDYSGHGRNGTITGSPQLVSGYQGKAYSFNGSTDYITVPLNINPSSYPKLTMGAWAKPASVGGTQPLLTQDDGGYGRQVGLDDRGGGSGWSAFCGDGWILGAVPAFKDKWTFVAVVYDKVAKTVRLQVDDMVLYKTGVTLPEGLNQMCIGGGTRFKMYFSGTIDNVFVFGDALTDQQLAYIRSRGAQAFTKPNPGLLLLLLSD